MSNNHLSLSEVTSAMKEFIVSNTKCITFNKGLNFNELKEIIGEEVLNKTQIAEMPVEQGRLINFLSGVFTTSLVNSIKDSSVLFIQWPLIEKNENNSFKLKTFFLKLSEEEATQVVDKVNNSNSETGRSNLEHTESHG